VARYVLEIKPPVRKELDALDDVVFARVDRKILALAGEPRPAGCKKLRGHKDLWRIRAGDYRVVYIIDDAKALVSITRVAHRREVYKP
jgi:mRNA interferase RelE/StbE